MNIIIAGDTHGDLLQIDMLIAAAKSEGAALIIQVGDFGFLWSTNNLGDIERSLAAAGVELWWLDGNHENFDMLGRLGASPDDTDATQLTDHVKYLPRGFRFEIDGCSFMAFGGAVSVDKGSRKPYVSWWPQENVTAGQVMRVDDEPVDVLLSHDAPGANIQLTSFLNGPKAMRLAPSLTAESEASRRLVETVYDTVRPKLAVHGHYHIFYTAAARHGTVVGLGCNGMGMKSWVAFDPGEFRLVIPARR